MDPTSAAARPTEFQGPGSTYVVKISGQNSIDYSCAAASRQAAVQEALDRYRSAYPSGNVRSCRVLEQNSQRLVLTLFTPQFQPRIWGI
jgi:hypothetical protein